jgi:hypothetical protein
LELYLQFWKVVAATHLAPDVPDTITWMINSEGSYSASSAYHMQFLGSFTKFDAKKIWLAHAEPKCKIFVLLALHGKLLTPDMLAVRGWPHNSICPLCLYAPETATHLFKDCRFTSAIWTLIQREENVGLATHGHTYTSTSDWWDNTITGKAAADKRRLSGRLLYVLWNA